MTRLGSLYIRDHGRFLTQAAQRTIPTGGEPVFGLFFGELAERLPKPRLAAVGHAVPAGN
ncbi:hypothetical protein [Streptomyces sp. NPDC087300]|uniref:hypothetical protein n=1 Tax=Streptomyces sp. NPDC087300 TaxID=3365780 RepID=UPI0038240BF7